MSMDEPGSEPFPNLTDQEGDQRLHLPLRGTRRSQFRSVREIVTQDSDKHVDFSLSQKDTLMFQRVAGTPRPETLITQQTPQKMRPKKARLEQMHFPLCEMPTVMMQTTTALMRAIKRVRVDRLPEYFEQTCDWRQYDTAVICGSSQLTYQELDQQANRLAHFFISHGVGEGNPIGILLDRSLETYIALLGILKAGAAFVPLDPSFPTNRVDFIAKDAGLWCLVTSSAFREKTTTLSCPVLELDQAYEMLSVQHETRPHVCVDPASLCYITYTLDATGQLRGVAVSHANIVNFLHVVTPIYGVKHNDRVYQGMSIAFDFSLEEIWPSWIAGATLVAGPTDSRRFGHGLTEFLIEHKISILRCMPSQLASIESDIPSLRTLIIGGEPCPANLVSRWARPGRRIFNTYGPSETTITATCSELFPGRPVTIGSPLPTYSIYILDNQFHPVKDGESGEIYIGGPSVAMGYLNHPDFTNERFILNPVWHEREVVPRLYRTGDIGRITPAGEIEYLGRIDTQVKSCGYRIELGEIEQMLEVVKPFGTKAISELEVKSSKLKLLKQINLKDIYKHIMTDPLYLNSLFNMAGTLILGGLGFFFWIIVARLYTTEDVGIATTLISIMTLLSSFAILGLGSSLNRYLPKSANKSELINSSFVIVTIATVLACVIFLLGLPIFSPQLVFLQSNVFYIISFAIFIIFCSWNSLAESISMAFRAAGNIFIKNIVISISKLLLPLALVSFGAYGIFASNALAITLGVLICLIIIIVKFKIRPSVSINISFIKETSMYSFANYITGFMFNMPSLVLPVIILNSLSAKYAAYYYMASMVQNILQIIPMAAAQALLTEGSYNETDLKKHVKKAIGTILIILTPAIVIIVFAGNILLQFFGKSYAVEGFQFLRLYSVSTIFTALLLVSGAIMNVKHQMRLLIVSNVMASILTLALSYAFISDKLVGIGWGWTLGQAIAGLVSLFFIIQSTFTRTAEVKS